MSWRTVVTVLIVVFVIGLVQSILAGPLVQILDALANSGNYNNQFFNGNTIITGFAEDWFRMGLIAIFGLLLWAAARVVRREVFRGRQRP